MSFNELILKVHQAIPRLPELQFAEAVNWEIRQGEQWAVIGPNGAGKTLLTDMLQGKFAFREGSIEPGDGRKMSDLVKSIAFKDIYSLADCRNSYYQQRWHSTETEDMPFVSELLDSFDAEEVRELLSFFRIGHLLNKRLIFLSSGELRKFLIVRTLLFKPQILILDNPFIGLDALSRDVLKELLQQIAKRKGVQVILLLSNPEDIPEMVTHILPVKDKHCFPAQTREEFLNNQSLRNHLFPPVDEKEITLPLNEDSPTPSHDVTLRMEKVTIRYGERTILKNVDWEVRNGEKWALFGPNGSGKSTLLSLVYADNPQAYANTLYLFDRKRGTGESIWDIKRRIGYVSPEMHLFYRQNVETLKIVGSGFFDSIGLYQKCNEEQNSYALRWMEVFGIAHLKNRAFLTLSSGEQRLALLARAFVKDPDLLILDEPLHGLDIHNKQKVARILEQFGNRNGKTLIYVTHYPHELPASVNKQFALPV